MVFYVVVVFLVIFFFSVVPKILPSISKKVVDLSVQDSDKETELREELKCLKDDLRNTSMTDEFAKYARTERKINTVKEEISRITKSKSEVFLKLKLGVNVIFQVAQYGIMTEELVTCEIRIDEATGQDDSDSRITGFKVCVMLCMIWSLRSQPLMTLPTAWLWPLDKIIAFPSGISGGIGVTCWILVCKSVTRQGLEVLT